MNPINDVRRYRFIEDYHFDNDIYDMRKHGAEVLEWYAKKGDIVFGKPNDDATIKDCVSVIISPSKDGLICLVPDRVLEEIKIEGEWTPFSANQYQVPT